MKRSAAEIVAEYGPFPGVERVNGVTYDGQHVWFASGDKLSALDVAIQPRGMKRADDGVAGFEFRYARTNLNNLPGAVR